MDLLLSLLKILIFVLVIAAGEMNIQNTVLIYFICTNSIWV